VVEEDFQAHDHSLAQLRLEAGFDILRDDPDLRICFDAWACRNDLCSAVTREVSTALLARQVKRLFNSSAKK
jgi:hypothetical protein